MDLKSYLKSVNLGKKIKLRGRVNKQGYVSLYLDLYNKGKREYVYLGLYLKSKDTKNNNKKLQRATYIRDQKEIDIILNSGEFKKQKKTTSFYSLLKEYDKPFPKKHFISFFGSSDIDITSIQSKEIDSFTKFLSRKGLSNNSVNVYISKVMCVLRIAHKKDLLTSLPKITKLRNIESQREFLTIAEIKKVIEYYNNNNIYECAFVLSCLTGLRYSDIMRLSIDNIEGDYIYLRQKKTREILKIKLIDKAEKILKEANYSFPMIKGTSRANHYIRKLMERCKIKKHISFHCARHTFACTLLVKGVDIYTVSKLLGHRDLSTTQRYSKLVDSIKDEAIEKLNDI